MKPSYISPLNKIRGSAFGTDSESFSENSVYTVCTDPIPTGMIVMAVYTAWQKVEIMIE